MLIIQSAGYNRSSINTVLVVTLNRFDVITPAGTVPAELVRRVDDGLRTVLSVEPSGPVP